MEEILASIRRIISDEGNSPAEQAAGTPASPPPLASSRPAPVVSDHNEPDVLELTEVVETKAPGAFEPMEEADVMFRDQQPTRPAPAALATRSASPMFDEQLLSQHASSAVSAAFGSLANNMLSGSGDSRTIEELVREMLKPMLKTWLEENLPSLVERLVRSEIERVSRGGR